MSVVDSNERGAAIDALERKQQEITQLAEELMPLRNNRRAVALAITKLEEARLWLGEAIMTE
jgi:hypothetical protein